MTAAVLILVSVFIFGLLVLGTWRWADLRADTGAWNRLVLLQPMAPPVFDVAMVAGLPEPAQRFFRFAIRPGTPLCTVAEIHMAGEFSLGTRVEPRSMPMHAKELVALPHGFVWTIRARSHLLHLSVSDAAEDGDSW
jgi:hypothetical protein